MAAWAGLGSRPGSADLRVWFLGLLTRAYLAALSTAGVSPTTQADLDDTPDLYLYAHLAASGTLEDGPDPAADLFDRLGPDRLKQALDGLPEEYRLVTVLYYLEDLSYDALGEITGQPVGAVRARLHRGRKMLQRAVWDIAGGREVATGGREAAR